MYNAWRLASVRDGVYSISGKLIASDASGSAGRFAGQETDVFVTQKFKRPTLGAGYGR